MQGRGALRGTPVPVETVQRLESGLRFLHVSAPQRVISPEEYSETPLAEFGLAPPRYVVVVRTATSAPLVIQFGDVTSPGPGAVRTHRRERGHSVTAAVRW